MPPRNINVLRCPPLVVTVVEVSLASRGQRPGKPAKSPPVYRTALQKTITYWPKCPQC